MADLQSSRVDDAAPQAVALATREQDMSQSAPHAAIRTPDQRVRVFVSSTLQELAPERAAARDAIARLRLTPVLFELGARPHPPRELYRAYLAQSDIFIGIYWQRYGWVAPGMSVSGLEDEYQLVGDRPRLIYVKDPAPQREPGLQALLKRIQADDTASYKPFATPDELRELIENDLALLLTERFDRTQLAAPSTPTERLRSNLPVQRESLIDRTDESAAARTLLLSADVGIVTLTGPGGSGKTRLALHVAADVHEHFEDGAFLVSLAPITDPPSVASTIAQTVSGGQGNGRPVVEFLQDYLRTKSMLLVLDNFEQVVAAAPIVAAVLDASPRLKVLVTSREPLHVQGEREVPVPPLAMPDPTCLPPVESLSHYAAVELFLQRVRSDMPDFALTDDNAWAVAEICRRVDGLPLAIELAAARVRVLPPRALLSRLQRRLPLLTGGARDLPARQQTMRNAIDWSYDLLEEGETILFRRMAVFVGGCTLAAIEAVCNAEGDLTLDVLDGVGSLVDKSLLRTQIVGSGQGGIDGEPRFEMLDTIREYALERLAESGEDKAISRAHAAYYLAMIDETDTHLSGADRQAWLDRLQAEYDNVRAALGWSATRTSDTETGRRLAGALLWFWFLRGYLGEGHGWLEDALAWNYDLLTESEKSVFRRFAVFEGSCTSAAMASVCLDPAIGTVHTTGLAEIDARNDTSGLPGDAGDGEGSLTMRSPAMTQAAQDEGSDLIPETRSLVDTGLLQREEGPGHAPRFSMRPIVRDYALKQLKESGEEDTIRKRHATYYLTVAEEAAPHLMGVERGERLKRLEAEHDNLRAALRWDDAARDDPQRGLRLAGALAWFWLLGGHVDEGRAALGAALTHDEAAAPTPARARALYAAGGLAAVQGDHAAARPRLEESVAIWRTVADSWGLAQALASLGDVAAQLKDYQQAETLLKESLTLCKALGRKEAANVCLVQLAGIAAARGQPQRAAQLLGSVSTPVDVTCFVLNGPDQATFEREVDDVRATLDATAFSTAWAAGQAMTPEQAIAYASVHI